MKRSRVGDKLADLLERLIQNVRNSSSSEEEEQPKRRRIQPLQWGQSDSSTSELDEEYVDTGVQIRMHNHNEFTKLEENHENPEESIDEKRYRLSSDFLSKFKSVRILSSIGKEKTLSSNVFRSFVLGFLPHGESSDEAINLTNIKNSLTGGSQLSIHLENGQIWKPHICFMRAGESTKVYTSHLDFYNAKKVYPCKPNVPLHSPQHNHEYYIMYHLDTIVIPWYARFEPGIIAENPGGDDTSFLCQLIWHLPFSIIIAFLSQHLIEDLKENFYSILYTLLVQQVSYTHSKERKKHELEWSPRDNEKWDNMNQRRKDQFKIDYNREDHDDVFRH